MSSPTPDRSLWIAVVRGAIAGIIFLLAQSPAYAHRLLVTHKVVEKELHVDVFFEDDSPGDGAKVQLRQGDTVLTEGAADETGRWRTPLPAAGGYEIRAEHTGHVAKEPFLISGAPEAFAASPARERTDLVGVQWTRLGIGAGVIGVVLMGVLAVRGRR